MKIMEEFNLKALLDSLLRSITSDNFIKINKKIIGNSKMSSKDSVEINEATRGHFIVLPKGVELLAKSEIKKIFLTIDNDSVELYKLNYLTQDYLEQIEYFQHIWDVLGKSQIYRNLDLTKYLNAQQLIELNRHKILNPSNKTKGYWFWRFYFECIYLNKRSKIYRIYCKEWGNKFWVKMEDSGTNKK